MSDIIRQTDPLRLHWADKLAQSSSKNIKNLSKSQAGAGSQLSSSKKQLTEKISSDTENKLRNQSVSKKILASVSEKNKTIKSNIGKSAYSIYLERLRSEKLALPNTTEGKALKQDYDRRIADLQTSQVQKNVENFERSYYGKDYDSIHSTSFKDLVKDYITVSNIPVMIAGRKRITRRMYDIMPKPAADIAGKILKPADDSYAKTDAVYAADENKRTAGLSARENGTEETAAPSTEKQGLDLDNIKKDLGKVRKGTNVAQDIAKRLHNASESDAADQAKTDFGNTKSGKNFKNASKTLAGLSLGINLLSAYKKFKNKDVAGGWASLRDAGVDGATFSAHQMVRQLSKGLKNIVAGSTEMGLGINNVLDGKWKVGLKEMAGGSFNLSSGFASALLAECPSASIAVSIQLALRKEQTNRLINHGLNVYDLAMKNPRNIGNIIVDELSRSNDARLSSVIKDELGIKDEELMKNLEKAELSENEKNLLRSVTGSASPLNNLTSFDSFLNNLITQAENYKKSKQSIEHNTAGSLVKAAKKVKETIIESVIRIAKKNAKKAAGKTEGKEEPASGAKSAASAGRTTPSAAGKMEVAKQAAGGEKAAQISAEQQKAMQEYTARLQALLTNLITNMLRAQIELQMLSMAMQQMGLLMPAIIVNAVLENMTANTAIMMQMLMQNINASAMGAQDPSKNFYNPAPNYLYDIQRMNSQSSVIGKGTILPQNTVSGKSKQASDSPEIKQGNLSNSYQQFQADAARIMMQNAYSAQNGTHLPQPGVNININININTSLSQYDNYNNIPAVPEANLYKMNSGVINDFNHGAVLPHNQAYSDQRAEKMLQMFADTFTIDEQI